jgi:hypothetical protein
MNGFIPALGLGAGFLAIFLLILWGLKASRRWMAGDKPGSNDTADGAGVWPSVGSDIWSNHGDSSGSDGHGSGGGHGGHH